VDERKRPRRLEASSQNRPSRIDLEHREKDGGSKAKAAGRIRTGDLLITNQLLYQLSYSGGRGYCTSWVISREAFDPFFRPRKIASIGIVFPGDHLSPEPCAALVRTEE
jgi:hypothetical protein